MRGSDIGDSEVQPNTSQRSRRRPPRQGGFGAVAAEVGPGKTPLESRPLRMDSAPTPSCHPQRHADRPTVPQQPHAAGRPAARGRTCGSWAVRTAIEVPSARAHRSRSQARHRGADRCRGGREIGVRCVLAIDAGVDRRSVHAADQRFSSETTPGSMVAPCCQDGPVNDGRLRIEVPAENAVKDADSSIAPQAGITVVMCAEDNETGPAAALLLASLRRLSQPWAGADVLCFSPREGHSPCGTVRSALVGMGAELIDDTLNDRWVDLPRSNKVLAAAWAERRCAPGETIVVVDSDTIFTADPQLTVAPGTAAVTPVWLSGLASEGYGDPLEALWQVAESTCGLERRSGFISPLLENKSIRPYFNSGLIAVRAADLLLGSWLTAYSALLAHDRFTRIVNMLSTNENDYGCATAYLDQVALALALSTVDVEPLPPIYNCPIHYLDRIDEPWRSIIPSTVVHVHYLKYLCSEATRTAIFGRIANGVLIERQLRDHLRELPCQDVAWPPTFALWFQAVTDHWRSILSVAGARQEHEFEQS